MPTDKVLDLGIVGDAGDDRAAIHLGHLVDAPNARVEAVQPVGEEDAAQQRGYPREHCLLPYRAPGGRGRSTGRVDLPGVPGRGGRRDLELANAAGDLLPRGYPFGALWS